VPTDRFASLPFAQPLALSLKRSPLLVTKNDAIEWDVKGGAGEYRYQLVSPMPGVSIRNDAPIIDIDIQSLQRGVAGAVWDAMPGRSTQRQSSVILKEYLERERPALASGFGIQAQGVPVALRLQIKVSDRENQSVTAIRTVLIDMPESALKDAMEEHDRRRSVDEQERAAVGAAALAGARAPKVDKSPTVMQIRIDELEKENLRLRAQVEILTSLLRNQNGAPAATQPSN
jgi:hypothetical protein